jgi:hypothetical protein
MLGNSWVAAQLAASQEGLNSIELVSLVRELQCCHVRTFQNIYTDLHTTSKNKEIVVMVLTLIQKLIGGDTQTHTQTATWSHKPTLFFQNKESIIRSLSLAQPVHKLVTNVTRSPSDMLKQKHTAMAPRQGGRRPEFHGIHIASKATQYRRYCCTEQHNVGTLQWRVLAASSYEIRSP